MSKKIQGKRNEIRIVGVSDALIEVIDSIGKKNKRSIPKQSEYVLEQWAEKQVKPNK